MVAGVISDTHGFLRPEAAAALDGVEHIIHAGDVGKREVLDALRQIAPVTAVRGNVDRGSWAEELPLSVEVRLSWAKIHVVHIAEEIGIDPRASGVHAVISGHSHRASKRTRDGVLYLNPGSAGPRRFNLPVTLMLIVVRDTSIDANVVRLAQ